MGNRHIRITFRINQKEQDQLFDAMKKSDIQYLSEFIRVCLYWQIDPSNGTSRFLEVEEVKRFHYIFKHLIGHLYRTPEPDEQVFKSSIEMIESMINRWTKTL